MPKKASLTELFYLTLLITALRPPDNALHYRTRRERAWYGPGDTLGPILAEDICYNSTNRYINSNGAFEYFSPKHAVLLDETHQVLEYINSLGRYGEPEPFSSNLFAYPMSSRGISEEPTETTTSEPESSPSAFEESESPLSSFTPFSTNATLDSLEDDLSDFDNLDLAHTLDDLTLDLFDLNEGAFLNNASGLFDSTHHENQHEVSPGSPEQTHPFVPDMDVDELLANSSVMFPILEDNPSDVNDLFGELELLLSNETENYGQEWQNSANFYNQLPAAEATADYSIYDSANLPALNEARPIEGSTVYEPASAAQMSAPSGPFPNGSNFGTVLYSSLTTLSNGNEHIGSDVAPSHLVYSSDINDLAYMSNVSNLSVNNVSTSDCFYNGYLPDELPLSELPAVSAATPFGYQSQQPSQPPCYASNSISHGNQFSTPTAEDCFDKSSDSAVSSMSSDRVHSSSENDWAETSSESSYNGEVNISDYSNNENKYNAAAQKKYQLFGKNKSADLKSTGSSSSTQEYYLDYGQANSYVYANASGAVADASYGNGYYAVAHNHTYTPLTEVAPLGSVSDNIPANSWQAPTVQHEANLPKVKTETARSSKSSSKKQQQLQHQQTLEAIEKDAQLNRDEKRARALKVPISTADIINLPIDEFNERLTKYELTEMQLSLIRDIRRRGKNKVAAQNCRKRKLDQIMGLQSEVDTMFSKKNSLESRYEHLAMMREHARDKYTKLYQFVVEASASRQPYFDLTASPPGFPDKGSSQEVQLNDSGNNSYAVSANITSASVPVSYGVQADFKQE